MADELDVELRTYQNYEDFRVPWDRLHDIARLTNVSWEWIARGEEPPDVGDELRRVHAEIAEVNQKLDDLLTGRSAEKVGRAATAAGRASRSTPRESSRASRAKAKKRPGAAGGG